MKNNTAYAFRRHDPFEVQQRMHYVAQGHPLNWVFAFDSLQALERAVQQEETAMKDDDSEQQDDSLLASTILTTFDRLRDHHRNADEHEQEWSKYRQAMQDYYRQQQNHRPTDGPLARPNCPIALPLYARDLELHLQTSMASQIIIQDKPVFLTDATAQIKYEVLTRDNLDRLSLRCVNHVESHFFMTGTEKIPVFELPMLFAAFSDAERYQTPGKPRKEPKANTIMQLQLSLGQEQNNRKLPDEHIDGTRDFIGRVKARVDELFAKFLKLQGSEVKNEPWDFIRSGLSKKDARQWDDNLPIKHRFDDCVYVMPTILPDGRGGPIKHIKVKDVGNLCYYGHSVLVALHEAWYIQGRMTGKLTLLRDILTPPPDLDKKYLQIKNAPPPVAHQAAPYAAGVPVKDCAGAVFQ